MFQFLQPSWLLAIAGIIIPVIIHLWSVKQGKILQVGSISLLNQIDRQQPKSIRLKDLLLLLMRCLLIILLAMLLSKPQYQKSLSVQDEKGWLLMDRNKVNAAYNNYKPKVDSLLKTGFKFHYFETGFKEADFSDALKLADDTSGKQQQTYWELLKSLEQEVPSKLPVYLFTDNTLKNFEGKRPQLSMNLSWNTFESNDSISSWLTGGYQTLTGGINVMVAKSSPSSTSVINQTFSLREPLPGFTIKSAENGYDVTFKNEQNNSTISLDTSTLNITIFSDKFTNDIQYLKAAINAIKDYGKYKIELSTVRSVGDISHGHEWLFWLSEQPVPQLQAARIFQYKRGKMQTVHSWINLQASELTEDQIEISKLIQTTQTTRNQQIIWKDGFGNPILTRNGNGKEIYHFYSRFNPSWNDLTWSSSFPAMIFNLLMSKDDYNTNALDKRVIDVNQFRPIVLKESNVTKDKFTAQMDLSKLFWILAFLLFCLERFISFRAKKEMIHG